MAKKVTITKKVVAKKPPVKATITKKVVTKGPKFSKSDTTVIAKPYKVTTKEIATDKYSLGLASPTVRDSTRKKIAYNLSKVIPSMVKRNAEREKEGKSPISRSSIMGNTVGGFSNKGKSFGKK